MDLLNQTDDRVFKEIFTRNKDSMADFLKCVLKIPDSEFEGFEFVDTHNRKGEMFGGEYIMDLNVKTKNHVIDVELQVRRSPVMEQRVLIYLANMIRNQNLKSKSYVKMKKNVSIVIAAEHNMNDSEGYIQNYKLTNLRDGSLFSDLVEIVVLELRKVPDASDGSPLWDWLQFLKTRDQALMRSLSYTNGRIKNAFDTLVDISGSEEEQHYAQQREFFLADQFAINSERFQNGLSMGLTKGRRDGLREGLTRGKRSQQIAIAKNLISLGLPFDQISKATGLSINEIEEIK